MPWRTAPAARVCHRVELFALRRSIAAARQCIRSRRKRTPITRQKRL